MSPVQRWDGHAREATDWNELRRDPELYFPDGNTLIYLYSRGRSQRGPSFRIPHELLVYSGCRPLVEQSLISTISSSPYDTKEHSLKSDECYLYLHAPQHLSREESFAYHVTTRNFFAWLMGVPIVGIDPVSALVALKDRMDIWRDEGSDNLKAIRDYIQEQGYGDMNQLEARLSPAHWPTILRSPTSRFKDTATLGKPAKRSGSVAAARRSLSRRMRLSQSFPHRPGLPLLHAQKQDQPTILGEGTLATIAYNDTTASTTPPTTTWHPKPRHTHSIGRNCRYTEIVIPDYGNGLYIPTWTFDTSASLTPPSSLPQTSPSETYTRRASTTIRSPHLLPPPPSPSTSSTNSSTRHSAVPSLASTYSTDELGTSSSSSPTSPTLPLPTSYNMNLDEKGQEQSKAGADAFEPDVIIDVLIGELEAAGLGGRPRYRFEAEGEGVGLGFETAGKYVV